MAQSSITCLFEDVPKGVEAAANASMKSIVITTSHEPGTFKRYENILQFIPGFGDLNIDRIHYLVIQKKLL